MRKTAILLIAALICAVVFFAQTVSAGETAAMVTPENITKTLSISVNRPVATGSQDLLRVYFDAVTWNFSCDCRTTAADILKEDSHIRAELALALALGKSVQITVDDSLKIYDDVCTVTNLVVFWRDPQ